MPLFPSCFCCLPIATDARKPTPTSKQGLADSAAVESVTKLLAKEQEITDKTIELERRLCFLETDLPKDVNSVSQALPEKFNLDAPSKLIHRSLDCGISLQTCSQESAVDSAQPACPEVQKEAKQWQEMHGHSLQSLHEQIKAEIDISLQTFREEVLSESATAAAAASKRELSQVQEGHDKSLQSLQEKITTDINKHLEEIREDLAEEIDTVSAQLKDQVLCIQGASKESPQAILEEMKASLQSFREEALAQNSQLSQWKALLDSSMLSIHEEIKAEINSSLRSIREEFNMEVNTARQSLHKKINGEISTSLRSLRQELGLLEERRRPSVSLQTDEKDPMQSLRKECSAEIKSASQELQEKLQAEMIASLRSVREELDMSLEHSKEFNQQLMKSPAKIFKELHESLLSWCEDRKAQSGPSVAVASSCEDVDAALHSCPEPEVVAESESCTREARGSSLGISDEIVTTVQLYLENLSIRCVTSVSGASSSEKSSVQPSETIRQDERRMGPKVLGQQDARAFRLYTQDEGDAGPECWDRQRSADTDWFYDDSPRVERDAAQLQASKKTAVVEGSAATSVEPNCNGQRQGWLPPEESLFFEEASSSEEESFRMHEAPTPPITPAEVEEESVGGAVVAEAASGHMSLPIMADHSKAEEDRSSPIAKLRITVVGAKGLQEDDVEPSLAFCTCRPTGGEDSPWSFDTHAVDLAENVIWQCNHEEEAYVVGQDVEFALWVKAANVSSDTPARFVGKHVLQTAQFYPGGFDTELELAESRVGASIKLHLQLSMVGTPTLLGEPESGSWHYIVVAPSGVNVYDSLTYAKPRKRPKRLQEGEYLHAVQCQHGPGTTFLLLVRPMSGWVFCAGGSLQQLSELEAVESTYGLWQGTVISSAGEMLRHVCSDSPHAEMEGDPLAQDRTVIVSQKVSMRGKMFVRIKSTDSWLLASTEYKQHVELKDALLDAQVSRAATHQDALGMSVANLPPGLVWVSSVTEGGWAESRGVQPGSVIVALNDKYVSSMLPQDFKKALKERPLELTYRLRDEAVQLDDDVSTSASTTVDHRASITAGPLFSQASQASAASIRSASQGLESPSSWTPNNPRSKRGSVGRRGAAPSPKSPSNRTRRSLFSFR